MVISTQVIKAKKKINMNCDRHECVYELNHVLTLTFTYTFLLRVVSEGILYSSDLPTVALVLMVVMMVFLVLVV